MRSLVYILSFSLIVVGCKSRGFRTKITADSLSSPLARDLSVEVHEDDFLTSQLVAENAQSFETVSPPSNGVITDFNAKTGGFRYSPNAHFYGNDSFTYRSFDGFGRASSFKTVFIRVNVRLKIDMTVGTPPPNKLSDTGLFQDTVSRELPKLGFEYDVQVPLWSDYTRKKRWLYLPPGTRIGFQEKSSWDLPSGAILVKTFDLEIAPGTRQVLETRLIIKKGSTFEFYAYRWDADERDATLVPDTGTGIDNYAVTFDINVQAGAAGGARNQTYRIPSRFQCIQCHHPSVGVTRSLETRQLNHNFNGENQLDRWKRLSLFTTAIGESSNYESYVALSDPAASPNAKGKAYLSVNCSHCHNPAGICSTAIGDARFDNISETDLAGRGLIVPGDGSNSKIVLAVAQTANNSPIPNLLRMPRIGSSIPHSEGVAALRAWIDSL